jgi:hypothetical protein
MKLFFTFSQLPSYIAGLMDLGEIDFGFDLGRGGFFPLASRGGLGRKMSADELRLVVLN